MSVWFKQECGSERSAPKMVSAMCARAHTKTSTLDQSYTGRSRAGRRRTRQMHAMPARNARRPNVTTRPLIG